MGKASTLNQLLPLPSWDSAGTWATFRNGNFHGVIAGNVEIQKCDDDLSRYEEIINISQPDLVIETGTRQGGSAVWFRQHGLQVISIDISPEAGEQARKARPRDYDVFWFNGRDSVSTAGNIQLQQLCRDKRVMVSLDSDHHSPHVQVEIYLWSRMVTPGCYLVVEDACFDMWEPERARVGGAKIPEWGGPLDAINKQQQVFHNLRFQRDTMVEDLTPISHSPVGWWRRDD